MENNWTLKAISAGVIKAKQIAVDHAQVHCDAKRHGNC